MRSETKNNDAGIASLAKRERTALFSKYGKLLRSSSRMNDLAAFPAAEIAKWKKGRMQLLQVHLHRRKGVLISGRERRRHCTHLS
jgi:hypothetical protein